MGFAGIADTTVDTRECPLLQRQIGFDLMPRKKNRSLTSEVKRQDPLCLALTESQAITGHTQIKIANRRLRKALEAITGWRMISKGGVPKSKFKLAVEYEDALRQVEEAFMAATLEWFLSRPCPHCGLRPRATKVPARVRETLEKCG